MSWHLGRLRAAGLVETRRQRPRDRLHAFAPEAFDEFAARERAILGVARAEPMTISLESRDRISRSSSRSRSAMGRLGLTPNALTLIGFVIAGVGAVWPRAQAWLVGGILVFVGGVFDMFDGALARATGKVSKLGAFMDSVFDRWGEGVVYIGIVVGRAVAGSTSAGPILAAAGAWARRSWSATPGPSPRASASRPAPAWPPSGSRRARSDVILTLGLIVSARALVLPGRRRHRRSSASQLAALGLIALGAAITVIQRILHVRSQAKSADTHHRPRHGARRPREQERQERQERRDAAQHLGRRRPPRSDGKIRVAIVGVGNCASSLVQGRYYYENAKDDDFVPGLMHVNLGGYHVRDIEFVAAFDIDKNKVGKDLSEAIYTKPNNTYVFQQVAAHRRHGRARHDPRRPRQVPQPDHREGARPHGRHRRHPQGARGRRDGLATCRSAARRPPSGTSSRRSRPASASSTPSRCSSAASRTGSAASPRRACRSSATTSRARSARRSPTAC